MNRTLVETSAVHLARMYGYLAVGLGVGSVFAIQRGMVVGRYWHDITAVFVWCMIAAAMLFISYRDNDYECFGKDETGRCSPLFMFVFLPYLIPLYLRRLLLVGFGKEDAYNKLCDGLWIGRRPSAPSDMPDQAEVCVDLAAEFPAARFMRMWPGKYHSFPILEPSVRSLDDLIECIDSLPERGIFIQCGQGHGRTGFFAAALLLRRGIVNNPAEAETLFEKVRPGIRLRKLQAEFLARNADSIRTGESG